MCQSPQATLSLSARRAWIEIAYGALDGASEIVALRKESVDRNYTVQIIVVKMYAVALRKESVDRNYSFGISGVDTVPSLSARRAWIEMPCHS